ncbi:PAS domain-containing protein [Hymenobacter sp. 15J16-1T3B]|uniref:PAS domain-containing protein n=1 Tax=Hymenobacter sp. 15J16-1T3B TaxID=2886941 RepID=UPI001D1011B5|nr:PAS domain-containing protein [Hymenobacter sp. 15J16-1T3B]MCC3158969.1 PAS domain-containing protein [Hymenobacter sp. 15J16-1T3B]
MSQQDFVSKSPNAWLLPSPAGQQLLPNAWPAPAPAVPNAADGAPAPGSWFAAPGAAVERLPVAHCTLSPDSTITYLNHWAAELLEHRAEDLLGRPFLLLVEPDQRLACAGRLSALLHAERPAAHEETLQLPSGPRRVLLQAGAATDGAGHACCQLVLFDVTQAQREAQALAASERKFRQLFEQSTDAAALLQNERFVDCNAAVLRLLGATDKAQIIGHYPWDLAPVEQRPGVRSELYFRDSVAAALRLGSKRCEGILCRLTGEHIWVEAVLTPLRDGDAALLHVVWRDITAHKQQERRHRESEERVRLLQETSGAGLWSWELTTNHLESDARARACLGWPTEEQAPANFEALSAVLHPDDAATVQASLAQATVQGHWPRQEFRVLWPDGTAHRVAASGWISHDAFGRPRCLLGVVQALPEPAE